MKKVFMLVVALFVSTAYGADYQFSGTHYIASYTGCDHEALCDLHHLEGTMVRSVKACGAQLLEVAKYVFPHDSITMVLLLSESHASIHTYPECDSCYVDLFTCGCNCDYKKFEEVLNAYLHPKSIENQIIKR